MTHASTLQYRKTFQLGPQLTGLLVDMSILASESSLHRIDYEFVLCCICTSSVCQDIGPQLAGQSQQSI